MEKQAQQTDTEIRDREMDEELANALPGSLRCFHGRTEKGRKEETRMSKMSALSLVVTELKRCGEALISISESLADLFSGNGDAHTTDQPEAEVPASDEKPISLEAVRAVLAEKSRSGHTAKVRDLLEKHGAAKLSEIDPAEYPALLAEAEVLGNE